MCTQLVNRVLLTPKRRGHQAYQRRSSVKSQKKRKINHHFSGKTRPLCLKKRTWRHNWGTVSASSLIAMNITTGKSNDSLILSLCEWASQWLTGPWTRGKTSWTQFHCTLESAWLRCSATLEATRRPFSVRCRTRIRAYACAWKSPILYSNYAKRSGRHSWRTFSDGWVTTHLITEAAIMSTSKWALYSLWYTPRVCSRRSKLGLTSSVWPRKRIYGTRKTRLKMKSCAWFSARISWYRPWTNWLREL